jgi:hypothetical protein
MTQVGPQPGPDPPLQLSSLPWAQRSTAPQEKRNQSSDPLAGPDPPFMYVRWVRPDPPIVSNACLRDSTGSSVPDAISGTIPEAKTRWHVDGDTVLAVHACTQPSAESADHLRAWWSARADEALTTLLRLDDAQLSGVNITSQTSRALRLRPQRFARLTVISDDGVNFPSTPAAFRETALRQAREHTASRLPSRPLPVRCPPQAGPRYLQRGVDGAVKRDTHSWYL